MSDIETVNYPKTNRWVGTMTCPKCSHTVWAWRSSGMSECYPHFYCSLCSNAIQREADKEIVYYEQNIEIVEKIAATLPDCSCGGRFEPGANPKCPNCTAELAHQADVVSRLTDPHIILLDGAIKFSDWRSPYKVIID